MIFSYQLVIFIVIPSHLFPVSSPLILIRSILRIMSIEFRLNVMLFAHLNTALVAGNSLNDYNKLEFVVLYMEMQNSLHGGLPSHHSEHRGFYEQASEVDTKIK